VSRCCVPHRGYTKRFKLRSLPVCAPYVPTTAPLEIRSTVLTPLFWPYPRPLGMSTAAEKNNTVAENTVAERAPPPHNADEKSSTVEKSTAAENQPRTRTVFEKRRISSFTLQQYKCTITENSSPRVYSSSSTCLCLNLQSQIPSTPHSFAVEIEEVITSNFRSTGKTLA
jgi:hypothetical protein